ncbi:UNVERIFIED_CONTAM: hypothetical protein RMT77_007363 [Armadillidium vulgare]
MDLENKEYDFLMSTTSTLLNTTLIHSSLERFSKWFWNPDFWLPVNFTWEDIQPREDFHYPYTKDLLSYPFYICAVLLLIRYWITDPFIFHPLARYYRLNLTKPSPPPKNSDLEKLYSEYGTKIPLKILNRVADKLRWRASDVQKWLWERKTSCRLTVGEKFADTGFKLIIHVTYFIMGVTVLHDKKWVWDIDHCWREYPHHEVDTDVWVYYMFGLGLYLTITAFQFLQPGGKDKLAMYVHHLFTISLISFSWVMNFVRVGTLVILVFQCSDWILLIAKLLTYLKKETLTNIAFTLTFISWIISRVILYPTWILWSALFEGPTYMFMPSAYFFYFMLSVLYVLTLSWLGMMIAVIYRKIKYGKIEDVRSSGEEDFDFDEDKKEE